MRLTEMCASRLVCGMVAAVVWWLCAQGVALVIFAADGDDVGVKKAIGDIWRAVGCGGKLVVLHRANRLGISRCIEMAGLYVRERDNHQKGHIKCEDR